MFAPSDLLFDLRALAVLSLNRIEKCMQTIACRVALGSVKAVPRTIMALASDMRLAVRQTALVFDVSIFLGLVLVAAASINIAGFAPASGSRNSAADEIAERFAAPEASGQFDVRFDFAPRLRFFGAAPSSDRAPGEAQDRGSPAASAVTMADEHEQGTANVISRQGSFDALGLVVVRDLPAESTLSAGMRVSPTEWAVAQADLRDLTLTLPGDAGPDLKAGIEIFDASGVAAGGMDLQIKRLPAVAAVNDDSTGGAVQPAKTSSRASPFATGAIIRKHQLKKPAVSGRSIKKVHVKQRKFPRRPATAKALPPPKAAVEAVETSAPAAKNVIQSLFTPAADTGKPVKVEGVGQGILINLGVFPRTPMEEESMRR